MLNIMIPNHSCMHLWIPYYFQCALSPALYDKALKKKKNVVLPSVTYPSQKNDKKNLRWRKHPIFVRLGVFEEK